MGLSYRKSYFQNEVTNELALSTARAEAIKQILIERYDIDADLIKLDVYSSQRPIAPNDIPEGRAMNQRVELFFSLDSIKSNKISQP